MKQNRNSNSNFQNIRQKKCDKLNGIYPQSEEKQGEGISKKGK
jgi:hypothetical protein